MTSARPRVAVIGVGTMGSMTLWSLTKAGYQAVGFERYGVPHDQGAHGAETRIYRQAYLEGPQYIPILKRSHALWKQLTAASRRDVFLENGCLHISDNTTPWLQQTADEAIANDVPIELLDDNQIKARYPQHRIYGGESAFLDLRGGALRPEQAVLGASRLAVDAGANYVSGRW